MRAAGAARRPSSGRSGAPSGCSSPGSPSCASTCSRSALEHAPHACVYACASPHVYGMCMACVYTGACARHGHDAAGRPVRAAARAVEHAPQAHIHMCILMCVACAWHVHTQVRAAARAAHRGLQHGDRARGLARQPRLPLRALLCASLPFPHLLPPSPTFSHLHCPSPTFSAHLCPSLPFSHLLPPSPTFFALLYRCAAPRAPGRAASPPCCGTSCAGCGSSR